MQRGWIAGRYNIKEKTHYCTTPVRWQFVNPADTSTAERERKLHSRERRMCNNNNTVMHKKRDDVIQKRDEKAGKREIRIQR
jgi:hypothetical protein